MTSIALSPKNLRGEAHWPRRETRQVKIGSVMVGGDAPIAVQSMLISSTLDIAACIREAKALAQAGAHIVRLTARSVKEAENLAAIRDGLRRLDCAVPLVADIHFSPLAALVAIESVDKVRINPGNYIDRKRFAKRTYTDNEYLEELAHIEDVFVQLVNKAIEYGRALRIGTNHGSLSDRITNRFGDTPLGMAESALEFARVAQKKNYHDIVISMKASNTKVMIAAYRLLVKKLKQEHLNFPLHLGLTEAGLGLPARIKSAVGIGALLLDGIGDTIRVSLTEDSINEIPVARSIIDMTSSQMLLAGKETNYTSKKRFHQQITSSFHRLIARANYGRSCTIPLALKSAVRTQGKEQSGQTTYAHSANHCFQLGNQSPVKIISHLEYDHFSELINQMQFLKKQGSDAFVFSLSDCLRLQADLPDQSVESKRALADFLLVCHLDWQDKSRGWRDDLHRLFAPGKESSVLGKESADATLNILQVKMVALAYRFYLPGGDVAYSNMKKSQSEMLESFLSFFVGRDLQCLWLIAKTKTHEWSSFAGSPENVEQLKELLQQGKILQGKKQQTSPAFCFSWRIDSPKALKTLTKNRVPTFCSSKRAQSSYGDRAYYLLFSYRLLIWLASEKKQELVPLILHDQLQYIPEEKNNGSWFVKLPYDTISSLGSLFVDGVGDALFFDTSIFKKTIKESQTPASIAGSKKQVEEKIVSLQLEILQATRVRFSKTEYIACPSCGRTLFSLQEVTQRIQRVTDHLPNVKIAIMGCIVNGPGEMADADFGYVGAGAGKIHLYHKHQLVKANIPEKKADQELIALIKQHNLWTEPAEVT